MRITSDELATFLGGEVVAGKGDAYVTGFASLKEALPGDLSFF